MPQEDIVAYARDAAGRGVDLFALLGTDSTATEAEIRRAFRRKALTAHPDKAGKSYDPALYEGLERARDVLVDPTAREAYDSCMRAALQKKMQLEQMSERRRQLVEDLERREEEARRARHGDSKSRGPDPERAAMAARGRAKLEEWMRLRREAEREAEERERLARGEEVATAASTDNKPSQTSAEDQPAAFRTPQDDHRTPSPTAEELDNRIAELEGRLKEAQQHKAIKRERKAEEKRDRAEKKAKKAETTLPRGSRWASASGSPPSPSTTAGPRADEDGRPQPVTTPPSSGQTSTGGVSRARDGFASVMARLRAAQAARNEERRSRAEAERRPLADEDTVPKPPETRPSTSPGLPPVPNDGVN
ncbi:hypothetical protein N657DRAFT_680808 [Parathielavia appendiculata]|uniref:J domain-containing protein n=1 Tax=Parathielavia appendiculata TaxID=2587402 RepID=A0AAN6Z3I2_9PEZI|nr:hypothetical protein N657DRAFT_680808 [Parathielavia appendiculata]